MDFYLCIVSLLPVQPPIQKNVAPIDRCNSLSWYKCFCLPCPAVFVGATIRSQHLEKSCLKDQHWIGSRMTDASF